MEAVGAASSIAGILSLAGQTIEGIIKLRGFVKDVKSSPKIVNTFLRDVESFQDSLSQTQQLISQLPDPRPATFTPPDVICEPPNAIIPNQALESLNWRLGECAKDVDEWLRVANKLNPGSATGAEAFFKKLRVAVNKDGFSEFHSQIARHQRGLGISLSVIAP